MTYRLKLLNHHPTSPEAASYAARNARTTTPHALKLHHIQQGMPEPPPTEYTCIDFILFEYAIRSVRSEPNQTNIMGPSERDGPTNVRIWYDTVIWWSDLLRLLKAFYLVSARLSHSILTFNIEVTAWVAKIQWWNFLSCQIESSLILKTCRNGAVFCLVHVCTWLFFTRYMYGCFSLGISPCLYKKNKK